MGPRGFLHILSSSEVVLTLCKVSCEKMRSSELSAMSLIAIECVDRMNRIDRKDQEFELRLILFIL